MIVLLVVLIIAVHFCTTQCLYFGEWVSSFACVVVMFSSFTCFVISELSAPYMKILALVALLALCQLLFGETFSNVPTYILMLSINSSPTGACVGVCILLGSQLAKWQRSFLFIYWQRALDKEWNVNIWPTNMV